VITRSLQAVASLPGPIPYPVREMIAVSAQTVASLPGPIPRPVRTTIQLSLQFAAAAPGLSPTARDILLLSAQLVADLPLPQPEPLRQLVTLTAQLLSDSAVARVGLLEQKIGATPEAAVLLSLETELKESVLAITQPICWICDAK
jgi:hypothetical protein